MVRQSFGVVRTRGAARWMSETATAIASVRTAGSSSPRSTPGGDPRRRDPRLLSSTS
jgi:hypothetical protein